MSDRPARVGIRADGGALMGTGHVVRSLALAEEVAAQGHTPVLIADLGGVAFLEQQVASRGLVAVAAPAPTGAAHVALARELNLDAITLDSYRLPPEVSTMLRAAGIPVLAVIDDETRGMDADVYVEQNLGSESLALNVAPDRIVLAGSRFPLLRDVVRSRRPAHPRPPTPVEIPHVVGVFGGSDPYVVAPDVVRALIATGVPWRASMIAASQESRNGLHQLTLGEGQSLEILDPLEDLPALLVTADVVISAAGSSTWELLCLGVPAALICVVDNQEVSYARVVERGVVAGLGSLADLRADSTAAQGILRELLTSASLRSRLSRDAWTEVDGDGRVRAIAALLSPVK